MSIRRCMREFPPRLAESPDMSPQQFLEQNAGLPPDQRLQALVSVLRGPQGCPWDQRQTATTIIDFVIDEAHELKEALARDDQAQILGELGDLAFTFTFLRQTLAGRAGEAEAVEAVVGKMVARHPHVFETNDSALGEADIKRKWESLKLQEAPTNRRLDRDLAASLPAWKKASKVISRARNAGFRYPTPEAAWEKVAEEWNELQDALEGQDKSHREAELGDLMLALLTASLEAGLDAEKALVDAARMLADRLERVEQLAGVGLSEIPYQDLAGWYSRARAEVGRQRRVYMNYCGVSPWPGEVFRAVSRAARTVGRKGLPGALELIEDRRVLRARLAQFLSAQPESVVLVPNVTTAAQSVAHCLDWSKGDKVVVGRADFPANTVPWRLASATYGFDILDFDDDLARREGEAGWSALENLLTAERPRLLAVSAVSYWSGYRWDIPRLARLCLKSDTMLYVDAIQALGTVPVVMSEGVTFLAGGSHKAMMAPEGAGFLAFAPTVGIHWVPRLSGWLSLPAPVDFLLSGNPHLDPNLKTPRPHDPTTLEAASTNALGYAGLAGSLDFLQSHGVEKIYAHVQALQDLLEPGVTELGFRSLRADNPEARSAILSFDPPSGLDLPELQRRMSEHGVEVSIPRGRLRFGLHILNTEADLSRALEALSKTFSRHGRKNN